MKITDVRTHLVHAARLTNWIFIELETDKGLIGTGEADLSGEEERVAESLEDLGWHLRGRNPFASNPTDQQLSHKDAGALEATVRSALNGALWDLKAQMAGVPLALLLGGSEARRIPLYANCNRAALDRTPTALALIAKRAVEEGFTAVKCAPFDGLTRENGDGPAGEKAVTKGLERIRAVRDAVGPDIKLMVDCHWRLTPLRARALVEELEHLNLSWLEDPFPEEATVEWLALQEHTKIPLAGGERATSLRELANALMIGQYHICTPDVRHIGGITALWHAAHLADAMGADFAPHNPRGPVGTLASGHVAAAAPSLLFLEFPFAECDWRSSLVSGGETVDSGKLVLPLSPGLGVRLDSHIARRYPYERVVPPRKASEVDIW